MKHIILAGDSVLDNGGYVIGPSVAEQITQALSPDKVVSVAMDGAVSQGVIHQIRTYNQSNKATHLVIIVGGNDALGLSGLLQSNAIVRIEDFLTELANVRKEFAQDYTSMIEAVKTGYPNLSIIVATVYYPVFPTAEQRRAIGLLSMFNDVILSVAATYQLPVIDLRWISSRPSCYANSIEPSVYGGKRIAKVIGSLFKNHRFEGPSAIYTYPKVKFRPEPFLRSDLFYELE